MQLNSFIIFLLVNIIKSTYCVPADSLVEIDSASQVGRSHPEIINGERKKVDHYEYRHVVAEGVQKALDECREKFKWDRWNCPKKAFLDILDRNPLPANKELGYTRALIASSIVLSLTRSCSYGTNSVCGCHSTSIPDTIEYSSSLVVRSLSANRTRLEPETNFNVDPQIFHEGGHMVDPSKVSKFVWKGCDEIVGFAFNVSKTYLENQDRQRDEVTKRINSHNYEVGRIAVKKNMKKVCKCHGVSGSCQVKTCWITVPDMSKVGEYLKRQYRLAAKVGDVSAEETNVVSLKKELNSISSEKLVFADASPDYCYENPKLGINGTLNRYCSRPKNNTLKNELSRSEKDSCDRLCTKCGYKIKLEPLNTERQCECRFVYCCSVECKMCPHVEDAYKCVRHS